VSFFLCKWLVILVVSRLILVVMCVGLCRLDLNVFFVDIDLVLWYGLMGWLFLLWVRVSRL